MSITKDRRKGALTFLSPPPASTGANRTFGQYLGIACKNSQAPLRLQGPVIDVGFRAGNLHFMAKTAKPLEPEVVELDDFFVHVAVSRDAYLSRRFQCEVSLYPRDADSQWSDLDLSKPAEEPQVLRAFVTRKAAYEHGIALGHILSSIY